MSGHKVSFLARILVLGSLVIVVIAVVVGFWWMNWQQRDAGLLSVVRDVGVRLDGAEAGVASGEAAVVDYSFYELLDSPVASQRLPYIRLAENPEIARKKAEKKRRRMRARLRAKRLEAQRAREAAAAAEAVADRGVDDVVLGADSDVI